MYVFSCIKIHDTRYTIHDTRRVLKVNVTCYQQGCSCSTFAKIKNLPEFVVDNLTDRKLSSIWGWGFDSYPAWDNLSWLDGITEQYTIFATIIPRHDLKLCLGSGTIISVHFIGMEWLRVKKIDMGIRVGNAKHENLVLRVSCFVYIDINTMTPSRNTKQTWKLIIIHI